MVIDTGGVITLSRSKAGVMEELSVTTTVGMDGIPLPTREASIASILSMIEKQAVVVLLMKELYYSSWMVRQAQW
ncbi:hypothetical protein ACP4OV_016871 [Aristida adscensionis]